MQSSLFGCVLIDRNLFPPSESCKRRVSLLSRYGTWAILSSERAKMTLPRAISPEFIEIPSFCRSPGLKEKNQ